MRLQRQRGQYLFWLNFHGLGDAGRTLPPGEEDYWTDPRLFSDILDTVRGRNDVQITFDDSNESDYTAALPLLKSRKMRARFFVLSERIGQTGFLSRGQIRTLCSEGMAVGNHGMSHRNWMGLGITELRRELVEARDMIEQITGVPVTEAACPFGGYNRRTLRMLNESGYQRVFTSDRGVAQVGAWLQPRITVRRCDDLRQVAGMCSLGYWKTAGIWRDLKLLIKRWR
jgi:peptidoglycan/xylan/chitin deacetylase (PgdA/CDA1 family)